MSREPPLLARFSLSLSLFQLLSLSMSLFSKKLLLSPSSSIVVVMRSGLQGQRRRARARAWKLEHTEEAGASLFCRETLSFAVEKARDT